MINPTIHIGDVLMPIRVRSVTMSERGQIVIPEDMRKDLKLEHREILVLIERGDEIVMRKESHVAKQLTGDEKFWKAASEHSLKRFADEDDPVWDAFAKKELKRK